MDQNKTVVLIICIIMIGLVSSVYFTVEKEKEFARQGLEECVIRDNVIKTIWVKDCNTTKRMYDVK